MIAEKFQAMVILGLANSRMKDFYDVCFIAQNMEIDGDLLSQAIKATFARRKTPISTKPLYLFERVFAQDKGKQIQWNAFRNKNSLNIEIDFTKVVYEIQNFLEPVYQSIAEQKSFTQKWSSDKLQWEIF